MSDSYFEIIEEEMGTETVPTKKEKGVGEEIGAETFPSENQLEDEIMERNLFLAKTFRSLGIQGKLLPQIKSYYSKLLERRSAKPYSWNELIALRGFVSESIPIKINDDQEIEESEAYEPRTELGRKLYQLRRKIVSSGQKLLSLDEIEKLIAEQRGNQD